MFLQSKDKTGLPTVTAQQHRKGGGTGSVETPCRYDPPFEPLIRPYKTLIRTGHVLCKRRRTAFYCETVCVTLHVPAVVFQPVRRGEEIPVLVVLPINPVRLQIELYRARLCRLINLGIGATSTARCPLPLSPSHSTSQHGGVRQTSLSPDFWLP